MSNNENSTFTLVMAPDGTVTLRIEFDGDGSAVDVGVEELALILAPPIAASHVVCAALDAIVRDPDIAPRDVIENFAHLLEIGAERIRNVERIRSVLASADSD